jgi:hypothetical protein
MLATWDVCLLGVAKDRHIPVVNVHKYERDAF